MSEETEVLVSTAAGVGIVRVGGGFDFGAAEDLDRALTPDPRGAAAGTVLDLSQVAFADSSFLHVLLRAEEGHRAAGVPLFPTRPSPPVVRLLKITDSARSLTLLDPVTAAAAAARSASAGGGGGQPVPAAPRRADEPGRRGGDGSEGGGQGGPRSRDEPCAPPHHLGGGA
ncbi:STAS domain-containing protein [Streptomyces somaliensis DSM 40738]|uniref:STAS domain-containing protein n=1 Tax=Streptomyces somaliensis TaxID=78355 RepID=UPI0021C4BA9A|nr:STAS domain-containing protein [Streptomyces somaliensis]MCQ0025526.1 STAS domain-containing protein [Streptomyces somaliensis DSM 40738]